MNDQEAQKLSTKIAELERQLQSGPLSLYEDIRSGRKVSATVWIDGDKIYVARGDHKVGIKLA